MRCSSGRGAIRTGAACSLTSVRTVHSHSPGAKAISALIPRPILPKRRRHASVIDPVSLEVRKATLVQVPRVVSLRLLPPGCLARIIVVFAKIAHFSKEFSFRKHVELAVSTPS